MEINLINRRVLITGGCGGIAKAIINKLIICKAFVIALDCKADELKSLEEEFRGCIETVCVDLNDWKSTENAIKSVEPIHMVVNNAGICILESFGSITEQSIDSQFSLNTKTVINVSQCVAKHWLQTNKKGSIVNISSQASMRALRDHTVYCATKGGLDQITKVMALELAPNIRVNSVNPTVVWTQLAKVVWGDPVVADRMKARIPMGRFAEPEEVADAVVFLLSDRSSMITGVCLPVDGGYLCT